MIAKKGQAPSEVLHEFFFVRTGQVLRNEKYKLWCDGPAFIEKSVKKSSQQTYKSIHVVAAYKKDHPSCEDGLKAFVK